MKKNQWYFIVSWAAVIAVAVAIFLFSAQDAQESTNVSHGLIEQLYIGYTNLFGLPCSSGDLVQASLLWDHLIRKLAHFFIYTLLGFSLCNAMNQTVSKRKNVFGISLLSGCLYAISDEIHQSFVPGRSCQLSDMLLDSCGVVFGSLIFFSIVARIIKKRRSAL